MNRTNILRAIDILHKHIYKCADQSIPNKHMRTEDEIQGYQEDIIACNESITELEQLVRKDKAEESAFPK